MLESVGGQQFYLLLPEHLLIILWFLAFQYSATGRFLNPGIIKEMREDTTEGNDHLSTLNPMNRQAKSHPFDFWFVFGFVTLVCLNVFNMQSSVVSRESRCH
jgi:hypothetical protein